MAKKLFLLTISLVALLFLVMPVYGASEQGIVPSDGGKLINGIQFYLNNLYDNGATLYYGNWILLEEGDSITDGTNTIKLIKLYKEGRFCVADVELNGRKTTFYDDDSNEFEGFFGFLKDCEFPVVETNRANVVALKRIMFGVGQPVDYRIWAKGSAIAVPAVVESIGVGTSEYTPTEVKRITVMGIDESKNEATVKVEDYYPPICYDTDGGGVPEEWYIKGKVYVGRETYQVIEEDCCVEEVTDPKQPHTCVAKSNYLKEAACGSGGNELYLSVEACKNGCENGECLEFDCEPREEFYLKYDESVTRQGKTIKLVNVETDGSIQIDVNGVEENVAKYKKVNEVWISIKESYYKVSSSERSARVVICVSGATCTDTDGGIEYYKKGTVTYETGEKTDTCGILSTETFVDECSGSDCILAEYFCTDTGLLADPSVFTCPNGCKDGACIGESGVCGNGVCEPAIGENTNNCPEDCEDAEETTCDGCLYNNQCVTYGYRIGGYYCSLDKEFKEQKSANIACENDHECISNLCAANKCVSASAWQRFLNWFSRIFGGAAVGIPKK